MRTTLIWLAVPLALVLLFLAVVYVDIHRYALALRLRGLYGLEGLQFRSGLATLQEVELATGSAMRPDGLFELSPEQVARLPRNWKTRGFAFLLPCLLACLALLAFLGSCVGSEPRWALLLVGGGYVAFCFGWDIWVTGWFDFQVGGHGRRLRELRYDELQDLIDEELREEDYSPAALIQFAELLADDGRRYAEGEVSLALADAGNAPTIKLLYRLVGWIWVRLAVGYERREIAGLKRDVEQLEDRVERALEESHELLREVAKARGEPPPYFEPRSPRRPARPLREVVRAKIEQLSEQRLLGRGDCDARLERLERIQTLLPA